MRARSVLTASLLATVTGLVGGLLAGCGGDADGSALPPDPGRTSSAPSTVQSTPTPNRSGPADGRGPRDTPGSRRPREGRSGSARTAYDRDPRVIAVRTLLAGYARSVNRRDDDFTALAPVLLDPDTSVLRRRSREDRGLRFPGPLPFAPLKVDPAGTGALVHGCMVTDGYAVAPRTARPPRRHEVSAVAFALGRVDGSWRVEGEFYTTQEVSCRGVEVAEPTWATSQQGRS